VQSKQSTFSQLDGDQVRKLFLMTVEQGNFERLLYTVVTRTLALIP